MVLLFFDYSFKQYKLCFRTYIPYSDKLDFLFNLVTPPLTLSENKKIRALKLLALKVAAHLNWNLTTLIKGYV